MNPNNLLVRQTLEGGYDLVCVYCRTSQRVKLPATADDLMAAFETFKEAHQDCGEAEKSTEKQCGEKVDFALKYPLKVSESASDYPCIVDGDGRPVVSFSKVARRRGYAWAEEAARELCLFYNFGRETIREKLRKK